MKLVANLLAELKKRIGFTLKKTPICFQGDFIFYKVPKIPDQICLVNKYWVWKTEKGSTDQSFS